jgi:hypothetical protein
MSAGLAATGASLVTSKFGVAGTLLGAALTAMLVTGGSAILRAYLETLSGHVRGMPKKLRARRDQQVEATMPGRPDLRDNFVGRMRAALGWFSNLPTLRRRSILMKGLLAAVVAFLLCMGLVWGTEKVIGNSLSCGLWAECPYGATPGVHPMGYGGTGANSSFSGGSTAGTETPSLVDRVRQNGGNPFGGNPTGGNPTGGITTGGGDQPVFGNPGGGAVPSAPSDPTASPEPGGNGSASPAAEQGADGGSSASPAAKQKEAPSSASPAAGQ